MTLDEAMQKRKSLQNDINSYSNRLDNARTDLENLENKIAAATKDSNFIYDGVIYSSNGERLSHNSNYLSPNLEIK